MRPSLSPKAVRLLSALVLSSIVHISLLWSLFVLDKEPSKHPQRIRIIHLIPTPKRTFTPKKRPVRKPLASKRVVRTRRKRRKRTRKRKRTRRRKRVKRRRTKRLAMAIPRPLPQKRRTPRFNKKQKHTQNQPPKHREVKKKRSYKMLDLRPKRLPIVPSTRTSKRGNQSDKGSKKKEIPWAGKSRFARSMRKYHNRVMEDLRDRRGLVDVFFGTASTLIDRCFEAWFVRNLKKHLTIKELLDRRPQWKGIFAMGWNNKGQGSFKLLRSKGRGKLNAPVIRMAKRCIKRVKLPKRLKGKKIWIKVKTSAWAFYRTDLKSLLGIEEYRDPQTGGIKIKFAHFGSIHVSSNSMILRQRITE